MQISVSLHRAQRALTLVDVGFVIIVIAIILILGHSLRSLGNPRYGENPRKDCRNNLKQLGRALLAYKEFNGGYLPAVSDGDAFRPMLSLAALYPEYVQSAKLFRCPITEDEPVIQRTTIGGQDIFDFAPANQPSYSYDELSSPRLRSRHAILGDKYGESTPWNHPGGQNVLYFDGHVKWADTVYASDDPADNIFCPNGNWGADTDAYLWDGANARPAQAD